MIRNKPHAVDLNLEQVVLYLAKELPAILAEQPVMLAYLHGSVVEGTTSPFSDVDLALIFEDGYRGSAYERMQVEFAIADEIEKSNLIPEADVRSIDQAPLMVQGRVLADGQLVYSRDEEFRVDYEVGVRKRYFDFLPVQKMMQKAFFQHVLQNGLTNGKP